MYVYEFISSVFPDKSGFRVIFVFSVNLEPVNVRVYIPFLGKESVHDLKNIEKIVGRQGVMTL